MALLCVIPESTQHHRNYKYATLDLHTHTRIPIKLPVLGWCCEKGLPLRHGLTRERFFFIMSMLKRQAPGEARRESLEPLLVGWTTSWAGVGVSLQTSPVSSQCSNSSGYPTGSTALAGKSVLPSA